LKLFEFAVFIEQKKDSEGEITEAAKILVDRECILAANDAQAQIIAGRAIPEEYMGKLDRVVVAVRPFLREHPLPENSAEPVAMASSGMGSLLTMDSPSSGGYSAAGIWQTSPPQTTYKSALSILKR
jgi:hypothetical protein